MRSRDAARLEPLKAPDTHCIRGRTMATPISSSIAHLPSTVGDHTRVTTVRRVQSVEAVVRADRWAGLALFGAATPNGAAQKRH